MIDKDYCSRCKIKDVPFVKYARHGNTQYYRCRPCNNTATKQYYDSNSGTAQKRNLYNMNRKYPEKLRARQMVKYAIKRGKISRSPCCEECKSSGRIEGHHMDYTNPLEVIWLCTSCHAEYHKVE